MSVLYRTLTDTPQVSEGKKFVGYAARFNQTAEIIERGQRFRERIAPGAFTRALAGRDIHGLMNHDRNLVLGRNKAGTLLLEQDKKGLRFEIDPPDTQYARDLRTLIERGDVSQCSFGATQSGTKDSWSGTLRTLEDIDCFDISIVSVMPGYPGTSVTLRFGDLTDPLTIHHHKARAWAALLGGK
jgi:HK97 family phage prohead protease